MEFFFIRAHSIRTPMVMRSLDPSYDPFRQRSSNESTLGPQYPYMVGVGVANYMCRDISFAINLLAQYSHAPTRTYSTGFKKIF